MNEFFQGRLRLYVGGFGVAIFFAVLAAWFGRGDTFEQRMAKLKPGMKMSAAMTVMGDNNKPKKRPLFKFSIGDTGDDRFTDFDAPIDTTGDGYVEYERGFNAVRISY